MFNNERTNILKRSDPFVGVTEPQVHIISIIADDILASIAPPGDMVNGSGEFKTHRTSHGGGWLMCDGKS